MRYKRYIARNGGICMDARQQRNMLKILLVEDSPSDIDLTKEALEEGKIIHELFVVEDGLAAMQFLHKQGPYKDAPRPDVVLLDLNLPKKDGREVLVEVKADEAL